MHTVSYTHTVIHPLTLVFRCPFHTVPQNNHYLQRASHGHTCHGVTPGPCHTHTVYYLAPYLAHVSFEFLTFAPCDRISGYTPRARPRALIGLRLPAVGSLHTCFPGRTYGCP